MTKNQVGVFIRAPTEVVAILDDLIENGVYLNRSDAIRDLIRKAKLQPANKIGSHNSGMSADPLDDPESHKKSARALGKW